MNKSIGVAIFVSALIVARAAAAQGVLVDAAASEPPSEKDKIALDLLRDDPKARVAFVDKIAAPVLNKMFECNMIP